MTKTEMAARLRELSAEMESLADSMIWYGGMSEIAAKGRELAGAAGIALNWAEGIAECADDNRDPADEAA